jgi:hypothetical protein
VAGELEVLTAGVEPTVDLDEEIITMWHRTGSRLRRLGATTRSRNSMHTKGCKV